MTEERGLNRMRMIPTNKHSRDKKAITRMIKENTAFIEVLITYCNKLLQLDRNSIRCR